MINTRDIVCLVIIMFAISCVIVSIVCCIKDSDIDRRCGNMVVTDALQDKECRRYFNENKSR